MMSGTLSRLVFQLRNRFGAQPDQVRMNAGGLALHKRLAMLARFVGIISSDLDLLAALYGTDKYGSHDYTPVYRELMHRHRRKPIRLLELGVGGYEGELGGESLLMWATYFPKGSIHGIDIVDKTSLSRGRVKVHQCSQTDGIRLTDIAKEAGPFDFIIDDGSHFNEHQIESVRILWPFLRDGGTYVIEDVQTSYWPVFGGGPVGTPGYANSCMSRMKDLVDSVNLPEFLEPAPASLQLDATIGSIAFHHNLVVMTKEMTPRQSNMPVSVEEQRRILMRSPGAGSSIR
jgi:demethylmacrocin O-methyltransferase